MYVLILTGGIGSGKSTVAHRLEQRGAVRLDLDMVAAEVRDQLDVTQRLTAVFGDRILTHEGKVDPKSLAAVAFSDKEHTLQLNAIMHPAIAQAFKEQLANMESTSGAPLVVVEIPLFTSHDGYRRWADEVMAVNAPETLRLARSVSRGMDEPDVRQRMTQQVDDEKRAELADVVLSNEGTLQTLLDQVDAWFDAHEARRWEPVGRPGVEEHR
jgi:dephospho-CoA kinase